MKQDAKNAALLEQLMQTGEWNCNLTVAKSELFSLECENNRDLEQIEKEYHKNCREYYRKKENDLKPVANDKSDQIPLPQISTAPLEIPIIPALPDWLQKPSDILRCLLLGLIVLLLVAVYLFLCILNTNDVFLLMMLVGVLAAFIGIYWAVFCRSHAKELRKWLKQYKIWLQDRKQWEEEFDLYVRNNSLDPFFQQWQQCDHTFAELKEELDGIVSETTQDIVTQVREFGQQSREATARRKQQFAEEAAVHQAKIDFYTGQLFAQDILNQEYWHLAYSIHSLLSGGRADTLKEALNLAIDEERKAREEAERRAEAKRLEESQRRHQEAEAAARAEHDRRMEREAEWQRQHQEAEAAARAEHDRRMEREAALQRQHQEAITAAQAQSDRRMEREAERQRSAARARCVKCANYSKCPRSVREASLTCGSYRPR